MIDIFIEPTWRNSFAIAKLAKQTRTGVADWKLRLSRVNQNGIYTATAVNETIGRSILFDEWANKEEVSFFQDKKGIWHYRQDLANMPDWE